MKEREPFLDNACPRCGGNLAVVLAYISIHLLEFDFCAGAGNVVRVPVPYCPVCEDEPEQYGCIHLAHTCDPRNKSFFS